MRRQNENKNVSKHGTNKLNEQVKRVYILRTWQMTNEA